MTPRPRREHPAAGHQVPAGSFSGLVPRLPRAGLVLGTHGLPVAVFRPGRAVRAVTVGPLDLAEHLVLRALATGAVVTTRTARPEAWGEFSDAVDQPRDRLAFRPPGAPATVAASASTPHLLLDDSPQPLGDQPQATSGDAVGWTFQVRHHDPESARTVSLLAADVLLVHAASLAAVADLLEQGGFADLPEPPAADAQGDAVAVLTSESSCWILLSAQAVRA